MAETNSREEELLRRIQELELENEVLKKKVAEVGVTNINQSQVEEYDAKYPKIDENFCLDEYKRYGRQMIVPEFGSLKSQIKLKNSSILVVGAGGLGCPALLYLSAAGIGKIGIVDDDIVDISNLHRQVLHTTDSIGMFKCDSAKKYICKLNPHVIVKTYPVRLHNDNAFDIVNDYDIVLDCTDTPAIRYLINDVSVLCRKTIVSGSGLKSDGQLSILNFNNEGPCYRCFYPKPPSAESITTCSDGGVIGPCIGLLGVSMAVETIKVLTGFYTKDNFKPFLSMYTGYPQQLFRVFKMRGRLDKCSVCGSFPTVSKEAILNNEIDYVAFCGKVDSNVLTPEDRITVQQFSDIVTRQSKAPVLLDVRTKEQFQIAKLPNSINIEWDPTFKKLESLDKYLPEDFDKDTDPVFVVCRYGNDSQLATRKMKQELDFKNAKDIIGGLNKWSDIVNPKFPKY